MEASTTLREITEMGFQKWAETTFAGEKIWRVLPSIVFKVRSSVLHSPMILIRYNRAWPSRQSHWYISTTLWHSLMKREIDGSGWYSLMCLDLQRNLFWKQKKSWLFYLYIIVSHIAASFIVSVDRLQNRYYSMIATSIIIISEEIPSWLSLSANIISVLLACCSRPCKSLRVVLFY